MSAFSANASDLTNLRKRLKGLLKAEGEYNGVSVPHVERRITNIKAALDSIPPIDRWQRRGHDDKKWLLQGRLIRQRRNPTRIKRELALELEVLTSEIEQVKCLGGSLVDGVNAYPLAVGKICEADMLLLMQAPDGKQQTLVTEVKDGDHTVWYAVLENLIQLTLFCAANHNLQFFERRGTGAPHMKIAGMVLAPRSYYTAGRQKPAAVAPARQLIEELSADIHLAVWDKDARTISEL